QVRTCLLSIVLFLCLLPGMLTVRNCNPCLDAAKACNLNSSCKRQRSAYIAVCSKEDPNKGETCSRKRCHKALRSFLDRVPPEFSHRLLFCPCQTEGCAERRRQTIVPDCSYRDKEKPNCLELQSVCRQDPLSHSSPVSPCGPGRAVRLSFIPPAGTEMTPNYVDNSFSNWTISPWCTCKGSGNQEAECLSFLGYFNNNPCLSESAQTLMQKKPFACHFHIQSERVKGLIPYGEKCHEKEQTSTNGIMGKAKVHTICTSNA
uniref:GDNF family receptor alpha 2 n=1 Tax=Salarias fasciatus TaxID=181472 RepID=A0A672JGV5_SALFA